jgi:thioredoxin 1/putative thioredoxin
MSMSGGFGGMRGKGKGPGAMPPARGGAAPPGFRIGAGGAAAPAASQGSIPTITEREFEREVIRSELPVLLEFTADWCAPCKQIAPEVEAFAKDMEGKVKVVKVDVDRAPVIAQQLRVQSVPTFMLFAEQRIVDVVVGAVGKKKLQAMVEPFLPRPAGALKAPELAQLLQAGAVTPVDTRDAPAYGRAHLPGARHIPIEELESRLAELHMLPSQPVLYCRAGDKTKEVAERLADQGAPVAFLEGGILAWEAEGLPIDRP